MAADNFWNNREQAQKFIEEASLLRDRTEPLLKAEKQLEDLQKAVENLRREPPSTNAPEGDSTGSTNRVMGRLSSRTNDPIAPIPRIDRHIQVTISLELADPLAERLLAHACRLGKVRRASPIRRQREEDLHVPRAQGPQAGPIHPRGDVVTHPVHRTIQQNHQVVGKLQIPLARIHTATVPSVLIV